MSDTKIIKTIQKVMPATVTVTVSQHFKNLDKEILSKIGKDEIDANGMVQVDGGSGFVVDKKGVILTNKHVLGKPGNSYTVITSDGKPYQASLLAQDPLDDIAILKINPSKPLPVVPLGDSDKIRIGETVLAFGNALGIFRNTVSKGIVSGLARSITTSIGSSPAQEMRGLIQTDAAINPGNSGGPLTNAQGRVIGINTAMIAGVENISFAIPIKKAERDLKDLRQYGEIRRPLLGIHYLLLSKDISQKLQLPTEEGALVIREYPKDKAVAPGGPADKADIQENDILLRWNGELISPEQGILDHLENSSAGEEVSITILRNGVEMEKTVILGERT